MRGELRTVWLEVCERFGACEMEPADVALAVWVMQPFYKRWWWLLWH